jgi:GTP-dependent dephospho-CoA kinase
LRRKLSEPLGRLFSAEAVGGAAFEKAVNDSSMVITVGDRVTETLGLMGRVPDLQVVDSRENRKRRELPSVPYARVIEVENPAGTLTGEAIEGVREAFRGEKPVRVLVEGEEDLMAIPVIALGPVSAVVFYGQPGEGIVAVKVDALSKGRSRQILAEMGIKEIG